MQQQQQQQPEWGSWKVVEGMVRTACVFRPLAWRLDVAAKLEALAREIRADADSDRARGAAHR